MRTHVRCSAPHAFALHNLQCIARVEPLTVDTIAMQSPRLPKGELHSCMHAHHTRRCDQSTPSHRVLCKWQQHPTLGAAQIRQVVPIQQTLGFPSQRPGGLRERRKVRRWVGDGWMRKRGALSPWSRCRWQRQLRKLQHGGYPSIRERFMCCASPAMGASMSR